MVLHVWMPSAPCFRLELGLADIVAEAHAGAGIEAKVGLFVPTGRLIWVRRDVFGELFELFGVGASILLLLGRGC